MAYPIPKSIAYDERIAFDLTAKQLAYAITGAIAAFASFQMANPAVGGILALVPAYFIVMIAAGFVFLDFERRIVSLLDYNRNIRAGGFGSARVRKFVEVDSVQDDVLHLQRNEMRAVIRVEPVNFSTMDEGRKCNVSEMFASFLQQLDCPIQLHARTVNVDISGYLDKCENRITKKDPGLLPLFRDFREYEEKLLKENTVRDRLFYIVVPMANGKDKAKALDLLNRKVNIILDNLAGIGMRGEKLNSEQLVAFVSSYFEDRMVVSNEYLGTQTLLKGWKEGKFRKPGKEETDRIQKLEKQILKDLICPSRIETKPDHVKVNETLYRVIMGVGYPKYVENGWLERLVGTRDDYDITIHIEPTSIEAAKVMLHRQIVKEEADLAVAMAKGIPNPSLENQLEDTKEFFDWLDRGEERLFNVSIYVMAKAKDKEQLDYLTDKCKSDMNAVSIIPKVPYYSMAPALQSVLPLGMDKMRKTREFPTSALAASFPFISSSLAVEDTGILIGHDKSNLNPIVKDLSKLSNSHIMLLAKSGAGKSYTAKLLITRMLASGTRLFIADPNGEYLRLCAKYGGQKITLSRDSDTIINPLDLFGQNYADKRISLMGMFGIVCGGLSTYSEGILDRALKVAYELKGITNERRTWGREPPTMGDVLDALEEEKARCQKARDPEHMKELQSLIVRVSRYAKGGVYSFVDRQTRIDVDNGFIVFDINDLPDEVKPLYMYIILDFIINMTKSDLERKAIVIDEGWSLLNNEKTAEHLLWMIKASRKFNTGMIFITQEVNDLLGSKAGESILANTAVKILLSQDSTVIDPLAEILHLNGKERNLLTVAKKGEGLLIVENTVRVPIVIKASPKEHDLITTHPDELKVLLGREAVQLKRKGGAHDDE